MLIFAAQRQQQQIYQPLLDGVTAAWGEHIPLKAVNYTHILPWVVPSSWFVHSQPSGGNRAAFPEQRAAGRARVVSSSGFSAAKTLLCPSWQPWVWMPALQSESLERGGIAVAIIKWTCFCDHSLRTGPRFLPGVPLKNFMKCYA